MRAVLSLIERTDGMRSPVRVLLAAALGAMAALGQAPWGLWPATVIGLALGYGLCARARGWGRAAWIGWAFGTGYFALAFSWIIEPFLVDVARHGWIAPFAAAGLAGGMAVYWGAAFAVARLAGGGAVAWIAALTLAEAARGYAMTGFPWAQPGHVWIDTGLVHWAAFAGSLGLTALALLAGAALWRLAAGHWRAGGAGLALIAAAWALGPVVAPEMPAPGERPVVRLIQPNAEQHEKWDPEKIPVFFDRQLAFSAEGARPDLIVWPETAVPVLLNNANAAFEAISAAAGDVPVVAGMQRFQGPRIYNSLVVLGRAGQVRAIYDKHHLVPFGEYVPFGDFLARFGINGLAAQEGKGYSAGPGAQVLEIEGLGGALPLICYEGVFPQDVRAAPERPHFMLLITNDAWFGKVSGPYQHLAQARLRSVEQGLPMIRVANTGISAMIDPRGRITAKLPLGQAGWVDAPLPPPLPPTIYARSGDLPWIAGLALLFAASLLYNRRALRAL